MARYTYNNHVTKLPRLLGLLIVIVLVAACGETATKGPQLGVPTITTVTAECSAEKLPTRVVTWSPAVGANGYRVLRNGEQLTEVGATVNTYIDDSPAEPGQLLKYVIRAINASTIKDSTAREFTVPPDECKETADDPDDPEDPDDQPEGEAPGPFVDLSVGLRCHPYGQVHASWTAIKGATSYTLLQGNNTIVEVTEPTGGRINATAELLPGQAFEFALQAHNTAGTLTGPITVPEFPPCPADQALVAAGDGTVLMVDRSLNLWGWGSYSLVLGEGTSDVGVPKLLQTLTFVPAKLLVHRSVAVILDQQGRVHVWGDASDGRLAAPGVTSLPNPTLVSGLEDIVDVAMGRSHILALDIAGRVWIWGRLLDRRIEVPEPVPLAEGIVRIAAGEETAFALRPNGTVLSWGSNEAHDVLGHGRAEDFPEPRLVPGIEGAESIYAARDGMFFVRHDGSAASLGDAFFPDHTPGVTERSELGELHSLSLGVDFGVAVTAAGEVLTWGENGYGQLGRPVETSSVLEPPQHVAGLPPVQAVFADTFYTVAVDVSGRLHAWGANGRNQLGLNAIEELRTFTPVALPEDTVAVETGSDFVLALGVSGTVYSWGSNEYGQLGRTTDRSFDWQPGEVENLHEIVQVAAGENFALALDSSGQVHTWGYAANGALGDGPPTSEFRQSPAPIPGFIGVEKVAAGSHHAVALQAGGHMYTWGAGTYGALGQGDQTDRYQPHSVFIPDTVVNDVAAGHSYTLFIANGFVLGGFGLNDNWQLGDVGTDAQYEVLPVAINLSLVGLTRVFAGVNTGFVVNGQGDLHAWGGNVARIKGCCRGGQSEPDMVQVPGVRDVVMVGAALGHALVIDGAVQAAYGLGSNLQFRLGLPVSRILEAPELLPLSGSVTHVSSSSSYSALVMDGVVHVVGRNEYGRLARPPMHGFPEPVMIDVPPVGVSYMGE